MVTNKTQRALFLMSLYISALLILSCGFSIQSSFHQFVVAQPLITNISNKGLYEVQLGLSPGVSLQSLPDSGFSPYIRFLSAVAPPATSRTIPNRAAQSGGTTVGGSGTQYNVPGSILRIVPIKSFDMTIYDSHGKVLWNTSNQIPSAGLVLVHVVFPKGTSGHITISIHDIKSPGPNVPTDSVDFGKWSSD
jgi:hypothetical protein